MRLRAIRGSGNFDEPGPDRGEQPDGRSIDDVRTERRVIPIPTRRRLP